METQYISLNMTPTGVNPCFHISQYDVGRMLGFIVHSGGATVDLDTYTCTVEATRSDGTAITSAVATTDNIGTFEVTPTMSNRADKYRCQLVIVDKNSKRIASLPFDIEVTKAAMDENSEAIEEDASLYQQYTEAVQGAIAEANANIQAEENARIAAVNAEASARQAADNTLQGNIDAEATARANADTVEATARANADTVEATARQTADNTLQGNINSEASTRASADSNLQSQINKIIAPSGEAPSAAEVQNARIGADGVTYDTLGTAIRTQVNDLGETIKNLNDGVDITVSDTIEKVGNYSYSVNIPNGFECRFTNKSKHICTLNVSDGVNETNISTSVNPNAKCEFVAPFNIKKIRCWFNDTDVSFKLKAYTKAESLNKAIGNELKGFLYISDNGDINIDVDGAYVNIKIKANKANSLTYRNPSFSSVVSADDIVSSIAGATYEDGVISLQVPPAKYLIYDIEQNKLLMTDIAFVDNSIILVKNWYGNVAGYWIEMYGYRQANRNKISIERTFNSPPMYMLTDEEVKTKSKEYSSLFANMSAKTEQFLFMTDAHYYNDNLDARENAKKYIATISKIYHSTPTSYVLDGGDWIKSFDDVNDYCYTMGLIKGECDSLLSPHYFALGNHDTNYQSSSGEIQKSTQKALWFSDKQNTYYSFVGDNTKWYVLDSGIDSDANASLRPFDSEQIIWLCNELKENTSENIAVMLHMIWIGDDNRTMLSTELEKIIVAFNSKTNYTHNDTTYDFSNANGKVKFVLCGHAHTDKDTLFGNVPVVCTTTARADFKATFDLCLADYGANKLYMIRVGSGENREFIIPSD